MSPVALADRLAHLADVLAGTSLPLDLAGTPVAVETIHEAVDQIEDYLLPRLADVDGPLLAVLGGSTGAGKSTITNSLVGADVTLAGVLRPTTRAPVLVHHPDDAVWFAGDGVLPDLPRRTGDQASGHALHLVASEALPPGLGLLDAPDIDSVESDNHTLAAQLLGAADLWVFVTTAARYADAVPWRYLARAQERSAAIALVVNRIPPSPDGSSTALIAEDVRRLLDEAGLAGTTVFTIVEDELVDGRLDPSVGGLRTWLTELVGDADARRAVVIGTLEGAVRSLAARGSRVVEAVDAHIETVEELRRTAEGEADAAVEALESELRSGVLLRGEVLDRFRETVSTGAFMDRMQRAVGGLRDRMGAMLSGGSRQVEAASGELRGNLTAMVEDALAAALDRTVDSWRRQPGGATILAMGPPPASVTDEVVAEMVRSWQDRVLGLVRESAGSKVALARGLSLGVNGIGLTLMVGIFASTGGLTGGEVVTAGGTAAVGQAVLSAVLGEQAVRDLAQTAQADLRKEIRRLADRQVADLLGRADGLPTPTSAASLRTALDAVRS